MMSLPAATQQTEEPPQTVAAVDIGSNAIRLAVAQVFADGSIECLEHLQRAVRLGHDTFRRGRLGPLSLRSAVSILRDFRRIIDLYRASRIRAVATSAVREAINADAFLERISVATDLRVEVINTSEESRLTVSAVCRALGDLFGDDQRILVADVGGGSTLLTLLQGHKVLASRSVRLGSVRMQELLGVAEESPDRASALMRRYISKVLAAAEATLQLKGIHKLVAVGGDARFAAREVGQPTTSQEIFSVSAEALDQLLDQCQQLPIDRLSKKYTIPLAEAETLVPALLVYQRLMRTLGTSEMHVSFVSMRDGLLLNLAYEVLGKEDPLLLQGAVHSAETIASRYCVDKEHARLVAQLALWLFDELQPIHRLGRKERLLLELAALLHEVGGFISSQAHHKHSYYVIANSEIFGLNRWETQIVAQIARYHRRSGPKPAHSEYLALPQEARIVVTKLAAILRVADALSRVQGGSNIQIRLDREDEALVIGIHGLVDLIFEERALMQKGGLFEDIFGLRVQLEEI